MTNIQTISLQGCIHSQKERHALKAKAEEESQVRLILSSEDDSSDSDVEKDYGSENDEESSDLNMEDYE